MVVDERTVTGTRSSVGSSLLDLLDDAASGQGTVRFVSDDDEATSVAALWRAAGDATGWFSSRVGPGGTVAMVLSNSRWCATALLGAWRSGCTVVSLPLPGRGMPLDTYVEQLGRFCDLASAQILMLDRDYMPFVADAPIDCHPYDVVGTSPGPAGDGIAGGALVQFTSGSLGRPKGIHLDLETVGGHVSTIASTYELEPHETSCSWLPLSHDMGLIGMFLAPLVAASPSFGHHNLVLMRPESFMTDPRRWLRLCSEVGANFTATPNFALDLAARVAPRMRAVDLSSLRVCVVGSESVRPDTLRRFTEAFAPAGFEPQSFCPAYGMAEMTLAVTTARPSESWRSIELAGDGPDGVSPTPVSVGRPVDHVTVRVAGPAGSIGEIEVQSPWQMSRYVGADLELTDDGYFRTHDLGMLDANGELFVLGRSDEVIVVAGRNIFPADVEAALDGSAVRSGCVAAVAAPSGGLAVVAEAARGKRSVDELAQACVTVRRDVAATVGLAPASVVFVPRGSLPKTPSGKIRRLQIRNALATDAEVVYRKDFS